MIIGDPSIFAIESHISMAYERPSSRALGFFIIHVGGKRYGRRKLDSTLLACSFDEVGRRLAHRGFHTVPFSDEPGAGKIADQVRSGLYEDANDERRFLGIPNPAFSNLIYSQRVLWAPDGDEAFDDGSYVLQFDINAQVRLIAFKSTSGYKHDPGTLRDIWLRSEDFYRILEEWHAGFEVEWFAAPKIG
jgi:hypothetical protein